MRKSRSKMPLNNRIVFRPHLLELVFPSLHPRLDHIHGKREEPARYARKAARDDKDAEGQSSSSREFGLSVGFWENEGVVWET